MEDFDRKEWLKTLKKGDKVANKEHCSWDKYEYYRIYKVKNITKTGKIRLDNDNLLDEDGGNSKYDIYIVPITDEVLRVNKEENIRRKFYKLLTKAVNRDYIYTTEQKKKIIELLESGDNNE